MADSYNALPWRDTNVMLLPAPHHRVGFRVTTSPDDICEICVHYLGRREDLVAAGVGTWDMVEKGRPGERRTDPDGDRCKIQTFPKYVILRRFKTTTSALSLPGVTAQLVEEALA